MVSKKIFTNLASMHGLVEGRASKVFTMSGQATVSFNIPPSTILRDVIRGKSSFGRYLETYELHPKDSTLSIAGKRKVTPKREQSHDAKLKEILSKYIAKSTRKIDSAVILSFAKEQQKQLALSVDNRDWSRARQLYLYMHDISTEEIKHIDGEMLKGDKIGFQTSYGLSSQLINFLSILPSLSMITMSFNEPKHDPMRHAWINSGIHGEFSLVASIINSAFQISMVARQELVR